MRIDLRSLDLKTFTEQDIKDYCSLNSLNLSDITELYIQGNQIKDISGIKLFKNLTTLNIQNTEIKDISVFKYLKKLRYLSIDNLRLESDQFQYIKNLEELWCRNGFKNMSVLNQLKNIDKLIK